MDGCYYNRLLILHALTLMAALLTIPCHCRCNFPAIFNFGDSTSDTGAIHFALPYNEAAENPPYGQTYFGSPAYRYSDGRLSIDFLATALGLPFLSPYLQSVGSNYGHGANFAASGATANNVNSFIAPISLPVQINQFKIFKQQVLATISAHGAQSYLPSADAFEKGIYMIEIGGNDFSYAYKNLNLSPSQLTQNVLPNVTRSISAAVQELYNEGARTILVKNVGPQGCQPFWLSLAPNDFDKNNCSISFNGAVQSYNNLLRQGLSNLRTQLNGSNIVYVNNYDMVFELMANPSTYGFKETIRACCGVGGNYNYDANIWCGSTGTINGTTVEAKACANPASYIIWDGVHWTEHANRQLTQAILGGKYFEPAFSIASQCDLQPF
eukprot:PITA_20216